MIKEYEYHPLSNLFPLMEGEEFDRLVDDIDKNGLLEPIVLFEGKILDGRNRYRACMKLGKRPTFKKYPNRIEAFDYVVAENIRRRHLNEAQISEISIEMIERKERRIQWDLAKKMFQKHRLAKKKYREEILSKVKEKESIPLEIKELAPKKEETPKYYGKSKIQKSVAKELPISEATIYKARKVKEIAEKEPKIAKEWEEAKAGKKGVDAVYNKALQVEQPPKTVNMEQKMINRFQQFHKEVRLKLRKDLLEPYLENTKNICKRYVRMVVNYLMNEFELGGVIDG